METTQVIEKVKAAQPTTGKRELVIERIEVGQWVRQGDIYIERLPDGLLGKYPSLRNPGLLKHEIARGHVIQGLLAKAITSWHLMAYKNTSENNKFVEALRKRINTTFLVFEVRKPWRIPHAEHAELVMPPGTYAGWAQVEVNPVTGETRQVAD